MGCLGVNGWRKKLCDAIFLCTCSVMLLCPFWVASFIIKEMLKQMCYDGALLGVFTVDGHNYTLIRIRLLGNKE